MAIIRDFLEQCEVSGNNVIWKGENPVEIDGKTYSISQYDMGYAETAQSLIRLQSGKSTIDVGYLLNYGANLLYALYKCPDEDMVLITKHQTYVSDSILGDEEHNIKGHDIKFFTKDSGCYSFEFPEKSNPLEKPNAFKCYEKEFCTRQELESLDENFVKLIISDNSINCFEADYLTYTDLVQNPNIAQYLTSNEAIEGFEKGYFTKFDLINNPDLAPFLTSRNAITCFKNGWVNKNHLISSDLCKATLLIGAELKSFYSKNKGFNAGHFEEFSAEQLLIFSLKKIVFGNQEERELALSKGLFTLLNCENAEEIQDLLLSGEAPHSSE